MSFSSSWASVENGTISFASKSKDERTADHLFSDLVWRMNQIRIVYNQGDSASQSIPEFTVIEELLAAQLTDMMLLAGKLSLDLPEAMAARNSFLRGSFKRGKK